MKTFAFHLQKGGVGKTTLSCSVAYECSLKGRTIVIDVDPQGNTSSWFLGNKSSPKYELANVLYGKADPSEAILPTAVNNLDIIPTFGIGGELKTYGENQLANEPFIFVDLLESLSKLGYEYAIFDLSPGMGRLERSALISTDEVITPMTPEAFSLDGIEIFIDALEKSSKAMRRGPVHNKIILNAYNKNIDQHNTILEQARKIKGFELFVIGVEPAFRKSQALSIPVQSLSYKEKAKDESLKTLKTIGESLCQ